jgi:hypothetical protein
VRVLGRDGVWSFFLPPWVGPESLDGRKHAQVGGVANPNNERDNAPVPWPLLPVPVSDPDPPLRVAVVALGREPTDDPSARVEVAGRSAVPGHNVRSPARYLWAMLLARLLESLRLVCPNCGADMHTEGLVIWLSKRESFHPVNPNLGKRRRLRDQEPGFGTRDIARSRCCRSSVPSCPSGLLLGLTVIRDSPAPFGRTAAPVKGCWW